ncbi:MAG: hypothetical protein DHS20C10_04590 [marine bacterium B5-7]|nr:MAG: hypothetical protein DHS20C10_04590 [marine bacterium B5-7]
MINVNVTDTNFEAIIMTDLETLHKQSPWLWDPAAINTDPHLLRLAEFPLQHQEKNFLNYTFEDGVYIVTGPRQIGKSTHLKLFIQRTLQENNHDCFFYFNCDLLDSKKEIVALVEDYLTTFPSQQRRYIFLDEVTTVKDSFLAIKYLVDSGHHKNITYVLTGSNTMSVKKTGEYLPGRRGKGIDFYFKPLNFRQALQLQHPQVSLSVDLKSTETELFKLDKTMNLDEALKNYLKTGGFPRVMNEYNMQQKISYDIFTIYRSWIISEIAKSDKKEYIAKHLLHYCLKGLTADVSYQSITQNIGIGSRNTVVNYIDFFCHVFVLSQANHLNLETGRIMYRKNKKIYFNDPFIYSVIDAWLNGRPEQDFSYLNDPVIQSQLIENLVYLKLKEHDKDVGFTQQKKEIDFITNDFAIEVKYQNNITASDCQPVLNADTDKQKIVLTKNTFEKRGELRLIPVKYFLLMALDGDPASSAG